MEIPLKAASIGQKVGWGRGLRESPGQGKMCWLNVDSAMSPAC